MIRIRNTREKKEAFRPWLIMHQMANSKPQGMWYSIGKSWHKWCKSEMPDWIKPHNYQIYINKNMILTLKSAEEILIFTKKYGVTSFNSEITGFHINWPEVAKLHSGIEINPYQWSLRLDLKTSWYYGWDCASGCIWNKKAIKKIRGM